MTLEYLLNGPNIYISAIPNTVGRMRLSFFLCRRSNKYDRHQLDKLHGPSRLTLKVISTLDSSKIQEAC